MVLLNANVLQIAGERGEDNLLQYDTAEIRFNTLLAQYLEILYFENGTDNKLSLEKAILNIKGNRMFEDLLKWEKMNYGYQSMLSKYKDDVLVPDPL